MEFRLTLFSHKTNRLEHLTKMSRKLEMKSVSPNLATFLIISKCVKCCLAQELILKLIAYYMAHFSILKVRNSHI